MHFLSYYYYYDQSNISIFFSIVTLFSIYFYHWYFSIKHAISYFYVSFIIEWDGDQLFIFYIWTYLFSIYVGYLLIGLCAIIWQIIVINFAMLV